MPCPRRRFRFPLAFVLTLLCAATLLPLPAAAANATNYTYTLSADGTWMRTQDAYLVADVRMKSQDLSQPQDLCVRGDRLYIADTGNGRIVVQDLTTGEMGSLGEGILQSPTGVCVTDDGTVYVADNGAAAVLKLGADGRLLGTYGRPEEATFGRDTQYVPSKVAVNAAGILYVVSEGSYDGIVQLGQDGAFLGYFGYNNTPMTIMDYLQDLLFTDAQKAMLFNRVPLTFRNLAMDEKGMAYTVTQSAEGNALKKHDISGLNLFPTDMQDEANFVDVALGPDGQVYAVTQTGLLFEYDTDGNLLFSLGGMAIASDRSGLLTTASGVAADRQGNVYMLDGERGLVHVLCPTALAESVHEAMDRYNSGRYAESRELWERVGVIGGDCRIVEDGIADCLFQQQAYAAAAEHYRIAENRDGYSQAYWQIRKGWVNAAMPMILTAIAALAAAVTIGRHIRRKKPPRPRRHSPFIQDVRLVGRVLRHPIDSFYAIRREGAGRIGTATLLYGAAYLVFVANFILRGFVVSTHSPANTSLLYVTVLFVVPVFLFVGSNFFVGEIHESEGRLRDIYIACAYVTSPFLTVMPLIVILSQFLTLAESRLLDLASLAVYVWTFVLLLISTKEIHAYSLPGVAKNLLITLFLMAVVVLAGSLVGMFWDQLIDFILSVVREVQYRVA